MKKNVNLIRSYAAIFLGFIAFNTTAQTVELTEGAMSITPGNSIACNDGTFTLENNFIRSFKISDYTNAATFHVDSVHFGVEATASISGSQDLDINLYSIPAGSTLIYSNLTWLATFNGSLPDISTPTVFNVPITADINGSSSLVVEIASPNGVNNSIFFMGTNNLTQSKPSYWAGPDCGFTDITDISTIGSLTSPVSLVISAYGRPTSLQAPDTFNAGKTNICAGETVTFSVPQVSGLTYSWTYSGSGTTINSSNNSATLVFSASATSGILTVTSSNGTITSVPRNLNLTATPIPAPAISRLGNVLSSSITTNCTWYRNNIAITGANSGTYTMTQNGSYFVKVTQNGCSGNSDTVQITDIGGTAVSNISANDVQLSLFPNPTKGTINIECDIKVDAAVFNMDGKKIKVVKDAKKIDIQQLEAGFYYILVSAKDGTQIRREKIIKL